MIMENGKKTLLDIAHIETRNGISIRITLHKKVVERLNLAPEDNILVFVQDGGKIYLDKLKHL